MNSIQELAQWVVDNRYPKSVNGKTSDLEMFHTIIDTFAELTKPKEKETCKKCEWLQLKYKTSVCKVCGTQCPF